LNDTNWFHLISINRSQQISNIANFDGDYLLQKPQLLSVLKNIRLCMIWPE